MIEPAELVDLYQAHRDSPVLSVYLDADQHDFAERDKWRIALKSAVSRARRETDDPEEFDRALACLDRVLEPSKGAFLAGRGWVGFATPDECVHAESVPVPMPNLVRFEKGLRVAPYVRALKHARPVTGVVIDGQKARILRYRGGRLTELGELEADTHLGDLTDMHVAKRAQMRSGVRGKTGTDAAQRFLDVERDRLIARVAEEVHAEVGQAGVVVLGGAGRTVDALRRELDGKPSRIHQAQALNFDMSDAELRAEMESAASAISLRDQEELLQRAIDRAGPGGDACLGQEDTTRALVEHRVGTLIVSRSFRSQHPDLADQMEGSAFEQGAGVVEMAGAAGDRLDDDGAGVGALLRYRVRTT